MVHWVVMIVIMTIIFILNLYLNIVLNFLIEHPSETVIIHLKRENISKTIKDSYIAELIQSVSNEIYNKNKRFVYYFYVPRNIDDDYTNKYMPILKKVRGKIVFLSRSEFYYTDLDIQPTDTDLDLEKEKRSLPNSIL